ncbi:MAG: 30S ribosomal protein S20 [Anaerolineaceae bacterium]|nr:30S ribosomal protein S20 [Anaerolineaceae bacterium]
MANIRSAIKRNRQNGKRRLNNRIFRGSARTQVRKARMAMEEGNKDLAVKEVNLAIKKLDVAAAKGIIHKNNAARRKSRLMKQLAGLDK